MTDETTLSTPVHAGSTDDIMSTENATNSAPVDGIDIWRPHWVRLSARRKLRRAGVTLGQATEAIRKLGEAAAKVPFPEGAELRCVLLRAWKRDCGLFRFFSVEWWRVFLDR